MTETDAALAAILADCATDDDLKRYIVKHALIVQYLVGLMGKSAHQTEAAVRTLYADWADLAVEQLNDSRVLPARTYH